MKEGQPGHFLVHVSERVFGYVLSYGSREGIKHLLIDASENCYMLLGDQMKFSSLTELVEYHQVTHNHLSAFSFIQKMIYEMNGHGMRAVNRFCSFCLMLFINSKWVVYFTLK